ncbi:MAG: hypothetical protein ACFN23_07785 [Capnocytophaga gingivalis]
MKKNYTFLAAICLATAFTVGCSKSDDSTSSTQTQTQTGGGQTGEENSGKATEKKAVAKVTTTGVTHTGAEVLFSETADATVYKGHAAIVNGKADLDVKTYIGKKLYFVVKAGNKIVSDVVEHTITEGDNAISIALRAIPQTGAKITVTKNGNPLQNQDVYFVGSAQLLVYNAWKATLTRISYEKDLAKRALSSATKLTTDAQGVANASISAGSYKVVILLDNDYKEFDLTVVNEQVKEAAINLVSASAKITLTKNGQPLANAKVYGHTAEGALESYAQTYSESYSNAQIKDYLERKYNSSRRRIVEYILGSYPIKASTNAQGVVSFENLENKRYIFVAAASDTTPYKVVVLTIEASSAKEATIDL